MGDLYERHTARLQGGAYKVAGGIQTGTNRAAAAATAVIFEKGMALLNRVVSEDREHGEITGA